MGTVTDCRIPAALQAPPASRRVGADRLVQVDGPFGRVPPAVVTGDGPAPTSCPMAAAVAAGRGRLVLATSDVAARSLEQYVAGRPS